MVITIDGPAGTGKSTVSRQVAQRLGFDFLDTGAMYRAVGLAAMRRGVVMQSPRELAFVAEHSRIEFDWSKNPPAILLNGEVVSNLIRGTAITEAAKHVAQVPAIRMKLVEEQRRIGREHGRLLTEGRDQGSAVFPDAEFKFYLTATAEERAHRRARELRARGEIVDEKEILRQIIDRDHRDSTRSIGPLKVPDGATIVDTTHLTQEQVVETLVQAVQSKL